MKKIIALMLVAVMMVMVLTSCDIVDKILGNDTETETKQETTETRYTITEDEWNALLNLKNYTLEITQTLSQTVGEETYQGTMHGWMYQSEVACRQINEGSLAFNNYQVIKDGKSYYFSIGEDGEITNLHETEWEPEPILGLGDSAPISKLSDLTYDEEKKAYCFDFSEESTSVTTYELYFENGKIVKIIGVAIQETVGADGTVVTNKMEQTMSISNIGTTVVEVPEFTVQ